MSALAVYRGLLENRALVRLLAAEFVSSIGDWLYLVALLVVVYRESSDPFVVGAVGAARIVPYFILSVPAGMVADRFDRRLVLLTTDVIRGAIMLVLAAVTLVHGPLWATVALAILATCFSPFFYPAIGAYIPALVRDERELGPANSAWASLDNLAFIVGPAIAGVLIAASDLSVAFLLNAGTFAVVAAVLWGLPPSVPASTPAAHDETAGEAPGDDGMTAAGPAVRSGIAVRAMVRPLAGLALVDMAASFVVGGLGVLTVILAVDRLNAGEAGTGYLNAAFGVGGLVGAVVSGALVLRRDLAPPLVAGAVLLAVGVTALGASTQLAPALVGIAVAACGSLLTEVVGTTIFQRIVPDAIRGRVIGVLLTASRIAYAAGALVLPVLASSIGALPVLAAAGIIVVAAALLALGLVGGAARLAPTPESETLRRVARLPIFAGAPPAAIEVAAAQLRPIDVAAGTAFVREGEPADRFYIIERGRFAVDQLDEGGSPRRLRTLGADEV
ncbi:MAG TPA: MFS transporter, partial [Candidatus Dormibacteraeota bacterium]|nr:MFS transporter [Candidatus Dormibacteraeota bacterium]